MTTHRAPKPAAGPATQPVERAVMAGLALAILAGIAWTAGMIYTLLDWPF
ncbi:morphogenic membrane protein MmpA [Streptomyces sp. NPDC087844]